MPCGESSERRHPTSRPSPPSSTSSSSTKPGSSPAATSASPPSAATPIALLEYRQLRSRPGCDNAIIAEHGFSVATAHCLRARLIVTASPLGPRRSRSRHRELSGCPPPFCVARVHWADLGSAPVLLAVVAARRLSRGGGAFRTLGARRGRRLRGVAQPVLGPSPPPLRLIPPPPGLPRPPAAPRGAAAPAADDPPDPRQPHHPPPRHLDAQFQRTARRLHEPPQGREIEVGLALHLVDGGLPDAEHGRDLRLASGEQAPKRLQPLHLPDQPACLCLDLRPPAGGKGLHQLGKRASHRPHSSAAASAAR